MSTAGKSLFAYGVYLLLNAAGLLFSPNILLSLFGLPGTSEPWIRMLGLVVGEIGFYFVFAARKGITAFYPATVVARYAAALVFAGLVVTGAGPWQLLIFAAVDLLAAAWTQLAIRRDAAA